MALPVNENLYLTTGGDDSSLAITSFAGNSFPQLSSFGQSDNQQWQFLSAGDTENYYLKNSDGHYFSKDPESSKSYLSDEPHELEAAYNDATREVTLASATENVVAELTDGAVPSYKNKGNSSPTSWTVKFPANQH